MNDASRGASGDDRSVARFRPTVANLGLLLVALALLALASELVTRLLSAVGPPLAVRHPTVGATYLPGFEGIVHSEESDRDVFLRFNREGFRGADWPYGRSSGTMRIAILGDSFVAGLACEEEETMTAQLARLLEASFPEVAWEVLNFGVEGSSTGQQLVLYRQVVSRYRPDLVILAYFVGNDFSDNSTRMSSFPRIYFRLDDRGELVQLPFSAARSRLSDWLNRHSRFYVWQKKTLRRVRIARQGGNDVYVGEPSSMLQGVWDLNTRLIGAFAEEVEAHGSRFALVVLPAAAQVYDDVWRARVRNAGDLGASLRRDYPDRRLGALGQALGVPVLLLGERLRAESGGLASSVREGERLYFRGYGHFTPRGHAVVARLIYDFLLERGLVSGVSRKTQPGSTVDSSEVRRSVSFPRRPHLQRRPDRGIR